MLVCNRVTEGGRKKFRESGRAEVQTPILSSRQEQIIAKAMIRGLESLPSFAEAPSEVEEEVEGELLL